MLIGLFSEIMGAVVSGDLAPELYEMVGIAEALQVHQDHFGVGIVAPVLEQVVTADICLVAGRNERGDPDPEAAGVIEHRGTHGSRLAHERNRTGWR